MHNTTRIVLEKTDHPVYTACEKQWEQKIEISVGLHLPQRHHGERVNKKEIPDEAIRKLLAKELSVVAGPVCVTESQALFFKPKILNYSNDYLQIISSFFSSADLKTE